MVISKHTVVEIDYRLTDVKGTLIDTSNGKAPLTYLHGSGGIIPGLQKALEGKAADDVIEVDIPPAEAYGDRQESLIYELPLSAFPKMEIKKGMQFRQDQNGVVRMINVLEVKPPAVRVDANHPLAGQTLRFKVTIVSVRNASPDEIAHGHAHGVGGHQH